MTHTTTTPETLATLNALELLSSFVDQRPCLNPADYGGGLEGWRLYRREAAEITRDRADFYNLLNAAHRLYNSSELNAAVISRLFNTGDRLELTEAGKLRYITGQYFPTEYRPAACRVLSSLIWRKLQERPELQTGDDIRKAARKLLTSRRTARNYFN